MPDIVMVGCKLPHGLFLDVYTQIDNEHYDVDMDKRIQLRGALHPDSIVGAGYGMTPVPSDIWEAWKAANTKYPPLVKGLIFEGKNANEVKAAARDRESVKSGFEALDPMKQHVPGVKVDKFQGYEPEKA